MIRKEAVTAVLGSPIAYYTPFAKVLGCVEAGVFASQMFYWYGKGHDPDGWIYKTQDEILDETGLTRRNQEMARRKMRQKGVLEEVKRGVPAKLFYRLNLDRLFELVQEDLMPDESADADEDDEEPAEHSSSPPLPINDSPEVDTLNGKVTDKDVQTVHPRMSKTRILESPNRTSLDVQTVHPGMRELDIQESAIRPDKDARSGQSNTETTTETTSKITTETTHGGGGALQPVLFRFGTIEDARARGLRETTRNEMAQMARTIIRKLPQTWRNAGPYVDGLSDERLQVLLTWLWLWQLTATTPNGHDVVSNWHELADIRSHYGEPFAGLENVPGYIRRRVEEDLAAELHETDLERLYQAVVEDA